MDVPSDPTEIAQLADTLMKFGVSDMQYKAATKCPEITM